MALIEKQRLCVSMGGPTDTQILWGGVNVGVGVCTHMWCSGGRKHLLRPQPGIPLLI